MNEIRNPSQLDGLLRGRDIVCFSHDWSGDPLSKTHLMRLLARNNRVLWVNSIGYRAPTVSRSDLRRAVAKLGAAVRPLREVEPNLFVLSPIVIPAYGQSWMRALNRRWLRGQVVRAMRALGFRRPLNWVCNPAAAMVAGSLGEERLIYYCVDEYAAFAGVDSDALGELEEQLLRRADLVVVSAERLYVSKSQRNARTVLVRHGVDYETFRRALDCDTQVPHEIASLPKPVLGYFGLMSSDWVDLELLEAVARHFATGSLVLLGKVAMDVSALQRLPNVHLLGRKPYEGLPAYCKGFDVGLIPFPINEVTLNANPLKAREYVAAGLPVVATAIPEVRHVSHCRIGHDRQSFIEQVEAALADSTSRQARSDSMRGESWEARLHQIEQELVGLDAGATPLPRLAAA